MAESTKLKLKFDTMSGSKTWTFDSATSAATAAQVQNLANVMIANASTFQFQPVRLAEAKMVETTERVYDFS